MKFTTNLLASAVLLATSSMAFAATDTAIIDINVTKDAYVNILGSFSGDGTINTTSSTTGRPVTEAELNGGPFALGQLGFESNTTGTCTVSFASLNDYKLVHDTNPALDLGDYTITYSGVSNSSASSGNDYSATTCNEAPSALDFSNPALPAVVTAGTYSDQITIVVTTQ